MASRGQGFSDGRETKVRGQERGCRRKLKQSEFQEGASNRWGKEVGIHDPGVRRGRGRLWDLVEKSSVRSPRDPAERCGQDPNQRGLRKE